MSTPQITPQLEAAARELHMLSCSSCTARRHGRDPHWACDGEWTATEIEVARSILQAAGVPTDIRCSHDAGCLVHPDAPGLHSRDGLRAQSLPVIKHPDDPRPARS